MPAWLAEGLAGFFETMLIDSRRVTLGRPPYLITSDPRAGRLRSSVLDGQRLTIVPMGTLPSLDSIIDLKDSWLAHDSRETVPRYAIAWALVDLLEVGAPDLKPRFDAYLGELRDSPINPREAFKKAFEGVPLQDRLTAYLRGERFPTLYAASPSVSADEAVHNRRAREMTAGEGHLHLAWLGAPYRDEVHRERVRLHLAAAKQSPDTRDAAYLAAALALYLRRDLDGAAREVEEGLRRARDTAPFLEAQLDILINRKAMTPELEQAAERLRQVATTGGQFCTLAHVAMLKGDREAALELGARAARLAPRLVYCRPEIIAQQMSQ
jgi:hypothetical protein